MKKLNVKVGQKVYWGEHEGEVVEIDNTLNYPIVVLFDFGTFYFTKDRIFCKYKSIRNNGK